MLHPVVIIRLLFLCFIKTAILIPTFAVVILANVNICTARETRSDSLGEPNAELAALWWPPQRNIWTPIGWKDHLFRFNVLYNGIIVAEPHIPNTKHKVYTRSYAGQGVTLTPMLWDDSKLPPEPKDKFVILSHDVYGGVGNQGWRDDETPVLWTEWATQQGFVLRQEIFGHIPGGQAVQTGVEPLYAWIRLRITHVDKLISAKSAGFIIHIGADGMIRRKMSQEGNLKCYARDRFYPRVLTEETFEEDGKMGLRLIEPDGRIRLVALPTAAGVYAFQERSPNSRDYFLRVTLPGKAGAEAILLLPMLPATPQNVETEMQLGFEKGLQQSNKFWSYKPATAALIDTPEQSLNEAINHALKFAEIIAEKNPETGDYSFLSSSWQYDCLWSTPTSMVNHMLLDPLGYHDVVEKHIEIYYKYQGTVKAPGNSYELHPGYFGTPKILTSVDWMCDHGAILHLIAKHALLTGDQEFIHKWEEPIIKACEFIKYARRIESHEGVKGIFPPAVATDEGISTQLVWTDSWNHKGLRTAVRLLKRMNHPRAEEFEQEADDYRRTFVKAFRQVAAAMPQWTDSQGMRRPVIPASMTEGYDITNEFYLDTGPLTLVWGELLRADDELMQTTVAYAREGPNTKLYDPRRDFQQRPVLIHEMSSCEPCYSWNIYHSWQLGDRHRYLEGMYSLLAGGLSLQTYISAETRHGIYGNIFVSPVLMDIVRLAVIDDVLEEDTLHLLRLVPLAWLKADYLTRFENMVTEYGAVTLRFKLTDEGKTLEVDYQPNYRQKPKAVILHIPPLENIKTVRINGKEFRVDTNKILTITP